MKVYLHSDNYYMHIGGVTLHDGYLPLVGFDMNRTDSFLAKPAVVDIEPAIWFKVLVLSSVTIDCVAREVLWSIDDDEPNVVTTQTRKVRKRSRSKYISESMYFGGESVFLDSDEVYTVVADILNRFSSSECTISELNTTIKNLLHAHILPAVKLTVNDLHKVEEIMTLQLSYIDIIDMRILSVQGIIDSRRKALYIRRQRWITLLKDPNVKLTYSKKYGVHQKFIECLYNNFDKDAQRSNKEFNGLDEQVQQLKMMIADLNTDEPTGNRSCHNDEEAKEMREQDVYTSSVDEKSKKKETTVQHKHASRHNSTEHGMECSTDSSSTENSSLEHTRAECNDMEQDNVNYCSTEAQSADNCLRCSGNTNNNTKGGIKSGRPASEQDSVVKCDVMKENGETVKSFEAQATSQPCDVGHKYDRLEELISHKEETLGPSPNFSIQNDRIELERQLCSMRCERDIAFQRHSNVLQAREDLKIFAFKLREKNAKKKKKSSYWRLDISNSDAVNIKALMEDCDDYLDCAHRLEETTDQMKQMIHCKVLALSVAEALKTTIAELKVDHESLGMEFQKTTSRRPTDVIHNTTPQTIPEQVAQAMSNKHDELSIANVQYWKDVGELFDLQQFEQPVDEHKCTACQPPVKGLKVGTSASVPMRVKKAVNKDYAPSISDTIFVSNQSDNNLLSWTIHNRDVTTVEQPMCTCKHNVSLPTVTTKQLNELQATTLLHLSNAVTAISNRFYSSSNLRHSERACWLAYEGYIYTRLLQPATVMYSVAYQRVIDSLRIDLPLLLTTDLELQSSLLVVADTFDRSPTRKGQSSDSFVQELTVPQTSHNTLPAHQSTIRKSIMARMHTKKSQTLGQQPTEKRRDESKRLPVLRHECPIKRLNTSSLRPVTILYPRNMTWPNAESPSDRQAQVEGTSRSCLSADNQLQKAMSNITVDTITSCDDANGSCRPVSHSHVAVTDRSQVSVADTSNKTHTSDAQISVLDSIETCKATSSRITKPAVAERASYSVEADPDCVVSEGQTNHLQKHSNRPFEKTLDIGDVYKCFEEVCDNFSVIEKLQAMVRSLNYLSVFWTQVAKQQNKSSSIGPCSDELLDALVLFLCRWDSEKVARLYPHVMFLRDHLPNVFDGGQFAYGLIQFVIAFDFIEARLLLKKNGVPSRIQLQ